MINQLIKKIKIDNCEYYIDLEAINIDQFLMFVNYNNIFYRFEYDLSLKSIVCLKIDGTNTIINDNIFIGYHLNNYLKILDNDKFSIFNNFSEIEYKNDKLIVLDNNELFFYDSQNYALFSISNYKINNLEMIYIDQSLNKIRLFEVQKRLNKLVKSNYEVLEIKLMGNEIHKLHLALNNENNYEKTEEILLQLKKLISDFKDKCQLVLNPNNQYYVKKKILNESRYFQIVFNNIFLLNFTKNVITLADIFGNFFIEKPSLLSLLNYRLFRVFILPYAELFLGAIELLSIEFYFERKIEIDQLKDEINIQNIYHDELIENYLDNSSNFFIKLFGLVINNFFKYTFEIFLFFSRQLIKIIFSPIFIVKNFFYNKYVC